LLLLNSGLGISIFLLGLRLLTNTLESVLGFRLRSALVKVTATKARGFAAGLLVTSVIQSSSAVCAAMVVLTHTGVVSLSQALAVMLGANVGTTVTAQIVAFPLEKMALPLVLSSLIALHLGRWRSASIAVFSLGAVFFGLSLASNALDPLLNSPHVRSALLNLTDSPWDAVLFGVLLTVLVQSSSAVTGLVIGLVKQNLLPVSAAVAVALGSNVGTVATTLVASWGRNRASRAAAFADLLYNLGGVLLVVPIFPLFLQMVERLAPEPGRQVAHAHTLFNVLTALLVLPVLEHLANLAWWGAGIGRGNKNKLR